MRAEEITLSTPITMTSVEEWIARRRDQLIIGHEFMLRLEGDATLESLRRLLPRLAFFTFAFQDMLKLARERCSDPLVTPIVRSLEEGDRGHDSWYVEDLSDLGVSLSAHGLFGPEQEVGRRVSYGLITLIDHATCDPERLAILLTLESAAREFFIRVPGFAARAGLTRELRYFGSMHLSAEEAHDVFTADGQHQLNTIVVVQEDVPRVREAVEKCFALLLSLASDLAGAMAAGSKSK
jgi:hypothetical protein